MRNHPQCGVLAFVIATLLTGCGTKQAEDTSRRAPQDPVVKVYSRPDYVAGQTVAGFSKQTGIKADYDVYDSRPVHEIKLLVGKSGYDVVVTTASFLGRLVGSGVFLELDRERLPNLANMDPRIMEQIARHDPGNRHALPYLWGTTGIGYNPERVLAALGMPSIDSWSAIFRDEEAGKLKACGIGVSDLAEDGLAAAIIYLGRDPNGENPEDLQAAEALWLQARTRVRFLEPAQLADQLARGELCVALGRNGDVLAARERAAQGATPVTLAFAIPAEGASAWYDVMAIPADAPHPLGAHAFLNYLMDPQVIADVTNSVGYANANTASFARLDAAVRDDQAAYPHPEAASRLHPQLAASPAYAALAADSWERIRDQP